MGVGQTVDAAHDRSLMCRLGLCAALRRMVSAPAHHSMWSFTSRRQQAGLVACHAGAHIGEHINVALRPGSLCSYTKLDKVAHALASKAKSGWWTTNTCRFCCTSAAGICMKMEVMSHPASRLLLTAWMAPVARQKKTHW